MRPNVQIFPWPNIIYGLAHFDKGYISCFLVVCKNIAVQVSHVFQYERSLFVNNLAPQ